MSKKYLVVGNPIEHSLSPKLHNYWFSKNNINAVYDKKLINESDIKEINPDLIVVSVPTSLHSYYTNIAFECGAHILVEKLQISKE